MSDEARGFRRLANGDVQLTMSQNDYDRLLMVLGYANAALRDGHCVLSRDKIFGLLNRLFDGSPTFRLYQVSERERDHPYEPA